MVAAICRKAEPGLPKHPVDLIAVIENHGVEGDYHAGKYIRHRWMAKRNPTQPNHRQILLVDTNIYAFLTRKDIHLKPGQLGENIVLDEMDIMALPIGTVLKIGKVRLEITEIRRPCYQLNAMHPELEKTVMPDEEDETTWKAGMMAVVLQSGQVRTGDRVEIEELIHNDRSSGD